MARESNPRESDTFRANPRLLWDPPSLLHNWYHVLLAGVKWPGRSVNHPSLNNAEVKERVELLLWAFTASSRVIVTF